VRPEETAFAILHNHKFICPIFAAEFLRSNC